MTPLRKVKPILFLNLTRAFNTHITSPYVFLKFKFKKLGAERNCVNKHDIVSVHPGKNKVDYCLIRN